MSQQSHPAARNQRSYRTIAVVAVALGLSVVPILALLGHRLLSVLWLATGLSILSLIRLKRPDGSWIAARGRYFDVVFGLVLAAIIFALSSIVSLPRIR